MSLSVQIVRKRTLTQVSAIANVKPKDTVASVMERIEEVCGVPEAQQRLVCQGWELNRRQTLEHYKIKIGDPKMDRGHYLICLVRDPAPVETVEEYKDQRGHWFAKEVLLRSGAGYTVEVLATMEKRIRVTDPLKQVGDITIRAQDGREWKIPAKGDDSVSEVKMKVQQVTGVPVNQQRLIGGARELGSQDRLRDFNIGAGDTLGLLLRNTWQPYLDDVAPPAVQRKQGT